MRSTISSTRIGRLALGIAAALGVASLACGAAAAANREGTVEFSDGEVWSGQLSLTPGAEFTVHDGTLLRKVALDTVREIRFSPEKEELVRQWRFLAAGQAKKEESGEPYPVRHIQATFRLSGQDAFTGHMYTTVLYVERTNGTEKVVLSAKQRGAPGTTLQALVYPVRIAFAGAAADEACTVRVRLEALEPGVPATGAELCGLTYGALVRLPAVAAAEPRSYRMPSPLGAGVFLALRSGNTVYAGWLASTNAAVEADVRAALPNVRDFFDQLDLRGVFQDPASGDVYSLMVLSRKGTTTMDGERTQPWRIEVWRWKYDEEQHKLLFASRGFFFRGIVARGQPPPPLIVSGALARMRTEQDQIVAGGVTQ